MNQQALMLVLFLALSAVLVTGLMFGPASAKKVATYCYDHNGGGSSCFGASTEAKKDCKEAQKSDDTAASKCYKDSG